ncbi:hypothetical protein Hanom_Chr06g00560861 [Helianthus anomalus]
MPTFFIVLDVMYTHTRACVWGDLQTMVMLDLHMSCILILYSSYKLINHNIYFLSTYIAYNSTA